MEALLFLGLIFTLITLVDQFLMDRLHVVLQTASGSALVVALITGILLAKVDRFNMCL